VKAIKGFGEAWLHPERPGSPSLPSFPVYSSTAGEQPVVLLHELPGMTPECVALARRLAGDGFKVHMPLLFGEPDAPGAANRNLVRICISAQMRHLFLSGGEKPAGLSQWIWSLMDRLADGQAIAVIGMCFTGGFALAGIAHGNGIAAVCSQPSMPLFRLFGRTSTQLLGETGIAAALARSNALGKCVLAMRYRTDWISRQSHIDNISQAFGTSCETADFPATEPKHALLTSNFSKDAYLQMTGFLNAAFKNILP
jgi:dienelactone hydrolase